VSLPEGRADSRHRPAADGRPLSRGRTERGARDAAGGPASRARSPRPAHWARGVICHSVLGVQPEHVDSLEELLMQM
jgi:hypothetical protein